MRSDTKQLVAAQVRRHLGDYVEHLNEMIAATALGNRAEARQARSRLAGTMSTAMALSELYGAVSGLQRAAGVLRQDFAAARKFGRFAAFSFDGLAEVPFEAAIDDIMARVPEALEAPFERAAQRIAELYAENGRVIAFAKAADQAVAEHVQVAIRDAVRGGATEIEAGRMLADAARKANPSAAPWSQSYARMTFRTQSLTSATAGRFRMARDPDIEPILPAFMLETVGDRDTRENHAAADGIILTVRNPGWNKIAPPLGYNCRCDVLEMSRPMLRRLSKLASDGSVIESKIPAGAGPDNGFRHGGRPDLFMTGA